jgi:hypothetical protein
MRFICRLNGLPLLFRADQNTFYPVNNFHFLFC